MARKRLPMNQVKEILRLLWAQKQSMRSVCRALGVSVGVVSKVSTRAKAAGLSWEAIADVDEGSVRARLYGPPVPLSSERPEPDPVAMHKELMRVGVTLELLHLEYLEEHPTGLKYTAFAGRYRRWKKRRGVTMRQPHKAGQNVFVDFSGKKPSYVDRATGERVEVELFVAALGASNLTYAEAVVSQSAELFVRVNIHALEYFGGATEAIVPDRLKAAIVEADPYDPTVQRSFAGFARHYDTAVVPARQYKPRDKAKVEVAVQIAQRWILARMRNERFFSLAELNRRIWELLEDLNARPMKKLGGISRRELFEEVEQQALKPLPSRRYEPDTWKRVRVHRDYHVEIEKHYYSAPYTLNGEELEARLTTATVELFYRGKRVASHARSSVKYGYTTAPEHMPRNHREFVEKDPGQLLEWAHSVGPHTTTLIERIMKRSPIALQGWRSARGLRRVGEKYGAVRTEEACRRALLFGAQGQRPVALMLKNGLDLKPLADEVEDNTQVIHHEQVRGPEYYN